MAHNYVVGLFKYGGLVELITRGGGGGGKKNGRWNDPAGDGQPKDIRPRFIS